MQRSFVALAAALASSAALADGGMWDAFQAHLENNWEQSKRAWSDGGWTLYLTGYTWHMPYAYKDSTYDYNEFAKGGGVGRYVYDDSGNYHGLYAIAFSDSHYKPEYQFGYNWQTYWGESDLKAGLGYTVFFFMRSDIGGYFPLPGIVPLASIRYKKAEVMGTFIPGVGERNGNIAFFFGRYNF